MNQYRHKPILSNRLFLTISYKFVFMLTFVPLVLQYKILTVKSRSIIKLLMTNVLNSVSHCTEPQKVKKERFSEDQNRPLPKNNSEICSRYETLHATTQESRETEHTLPSLCSPSDTEKSLAL